MGNIDLWLGNIDLWLWLGYGMRNFNPKIMIIRNVTKTRTTLYWS